MRKTLLTAAAIALIAASPTRATTIIGNDLLTLCEGERTDPGHALCLGYVTGIADLTLVLTAQNMTLIDEDGGDATAAFKWCKPDGVTNGQLVNVVVRELRAHPEDRHLWALRLIIRALRTSFPCY
jgi:hypothetical protein